MKSNRCCAVLIVAILLGLLAAGSARAQGGVGVRAGVSGEPNQFYFGAHDEVGPVVNHLWFRPNAEIGFGDHATLVSFNIEFANHVRLPRSEWDAYFGGGPALIISRAREDTSAGGGFNILVGLAHRKGLFAELKVGLIDSPSVKFGVGYTFR